jgi:hypothetical protein
MQVKTKYAGSILQNTYGITLGANYKNFDLSVGYGTSEQVYNGKSTTFCRRKYRELSSDRFWTPNNTGAQIQHHSTRCQ